MKPLLLLLALCLTIPAAQAQTAPPPKYWVFLVDKQEANGRPTPVEPGYVKAEAQARRALRGKALPADLDRPLSTRYLHALQEAGLTLLVQSRWLNAVSVRMTPLQAATVAALPFVRTVQPVRMLAAAHTHAITTSLLEAPAVVLFPPATRLDYGASLTQLALVNAVNPLEQGINGAGVRLGFLDTGFTHFDFSHPALAHLVAEGRVIATQDFTNLPDDGNRHGMNVLSVAAGFAEGQLIGPAWGAQILGARTEYAPTETNQEEDNYVAGLEWLESQGVDVVNASLGYSTFDAGQRSYTYADMDGETAVTTVAVDMAVLLGVVVVNSAGNEGSGTWHFITSPADADEVIAVGAATPSGLRASFSSFGPTSDGRIKPDVSAMGSSVVLATSTNSYNLQGAGTSFSSPMVAAVVAQMLQVNPDLTPAEVRDVLRETASLAETPNNELGWGIIDADAAITRAIVLDREEAELPARLHLRPPYPNPFNGHTTFELEWMPGRTPPTSLRLRLYNALGQHVATPFEGQPDAGLTRISFEADTLPAGVYLYRLEGEGVLATGTVVVQ
jgi:hypothetical protein